MFGLPYQHTMTQWDDETMQAEDVQPVKPMIAAILNGFAIPRLYSKVGEIVPYCYAYPA